ncbi:uncharacterized protein LOC125601889 [Brassica napus]|uniref:uncharacterized protein LOC125601889 n=1 Tax=Brassica napus TaxID=3708 RepID=UPI0020786248|nr:uncharacterized protein LOC125601889 [Brassica napus]
MDCYENICIVHPRTYNDHDILAILELSLPTCCIVDLFLEFILISSLRPKVCVSTLENKTWDAAATASLIRSSVLPRKASDNGAGSMFLTASGPGFTRSGPGRQLRFRQNAFARFSRPLQSSTARRSFVLKLQHLMMMLPLCC